MIILAAGVGSRMRSPLPKPLTLINGTPSIIRIISVFSHIVDRFVIVVSESNKVLITEAVMTYFSSIPVDYKIQKERKGILDAVSLVEESTRNEDCWLIWGDQPMYDFSTASEFNRLVVEAVPDVFIPLFMKNDKYVSYDFRRGKLANIRQAREGDFINGPALADGGLFYFKVSFLQTALSYKDNVLAGKNTREQNFIDVFVHMQKLESVDVVFKQYEVEYGLGFNTPEEVKNLELILTVREDENI